jgi:hypothetical protein
VSSQQAMALVIFLRWLTRLDVCRTHTIVVMGFLLLLQWLAGQSETRSCQKQHHFIDEWIGIGKRHTEIQSDHSRVYSSSENNATKKCFYQNLHLKCPKSFSQP